MLCSISFLFTGLMNSYGQSIGIGTTSPHPSSKLEIQSTSQGLLVPRMTTTERTAITTPATGLLVFDTDTNSFWFFGGASWTNLLSNSFIGTTDSQPLLFKVNNQRVGLLEMSDAYTNGNIAFGYRSLANNTGFLNIAIGRDALGSMNGFRTELIAIGDSALFHNDAHQNIAIGSKALLANSAGNLNLAIGGLALTSNSTGYQNVAVGASSLYSNTTGGNNTGVGYLSLAANTTGIGNTALGFSALRYSTGSSNVGVGRGTLSYNTGDFNTGIGLNSLNNNSTGTQNTAVGAYSLNSNSTGIQNTALGYFADVLADNLVNATAIGYNAKVTASNKVRIGNGAVTVIEGPVAFTTPSDGRFKYNIQEDVRGLAFIMKLRPITYQFDMKRFDEQPGTGNVSLVNYDEASLMRRSGFIAQEVEKAALESKYDFNGIIKPKSEKDHYGLSYESFVVPLVKAIQEQQQIIEEQKEELLHVKFELAELKKMVEELKKTNR